MASRIVTCVRAGDTVARLGGDEFAILLEGGSEPPLTVAHRVFDAFDQPFLLEGREVFMRRSVGVSSGSAGADHEDTAEALFKQADLAMYVAKRSQHGGVRAFAPDMYAIDVREVGPPPHRNITARRHGAAGRQLFAQLRRAIDENGLMGALTEAVIRRAARDAAVWRAQGSDVAFAVNLFPPSLADVELPNRIVRVLDDSGLAPACLTVEITEDFLLTDLKQVLKVLDRLRYFGIRVAIDDFGSGYSALSYLRELPIDELKLDGQVIAPILSDPRADAIVRAMIDLTRTLGLTCVAEGVENAATAARLADHGCDVVQGYWCSPPVEASGLLHVGPMSPIGGAAPFDGR